MIHYEPLDLYTLLWDKKFVKENVLPLFKTKNNMDNNINDYKEKFKELALEMCREMGVQYADIEISFDNEEDIRVNFRF